MRTAGGDVIPQFRRAGLKARKRPKTRVAVPPPWNRHTFTCRLSRRNTRMGSPPSEPVRQTVGHDNHVAFADVADLSILDFCAANLVWSYGFWMKRRATGYENGGAFQDVDDVGIPDMDFCHS